MPSSTKQYPRKRGLKKLLLSLLLVAIAVGALLEFFTMSVKVGDEHKVILANWSEFAGVFDQPKSDDFDYRVEAVDGGPVTRKDHAGLVSWVPVVLLSEGEHTLTIGKGKRWLFDPPEMEFFPISVTVEAGKHYDLVWESDSLVLTER